ncbi:hypothetical protein NDU88_004511 [Pleurodeles waltl]|uniref:Uncharacterized protein n=1 Tax=Pleurodeles waltl TaxID=8319 RepID=A0AAV7W572_PLEWA|nr:hypothetical protein NDU88_004511 [Pleurodeles waltl]
MDSYGLDQSCRAAKSPPAAWVTDAACVASVPFALSGSAGTERTLTPKPPTEAPATNRTCGTFRLSLAANTDQMAGTGRL